MGLRVTKPAYMYIQSEPRLWTVGFESDGRWEPESDHESPEAAERRVEILNAPTLAYELRELRAENAELREYGLQAASELGTLSAEIGRLRETCSLLRAALQDAVSSTGGGLIVQDYGRLNEALAGPKDG
jgi:hypothetical protein